MTQEPLQLDGIGESYTWSTPKTEAQVCFICDSPNHDSSVHDDEPVWDGSCPFCGGQGHICPG